MAIPTKHTAGEWSFDRWPLGWFVEAPSPDGSGKRVTVAEIRETPLGVFYSHQAQWNARLLAASPALLDACVRIVAVCREIPEASAIFGAADFEMVRAAIEKATGEDVLL